MKVGMYFDYVGTIMTPVEEEYKEAEEWVNKLFPKNEHIFKRNLNPHQLDNERLALYLFDIGGLCGSYGGMIDNLLHSLIKQIEDHPDTLFIMWSSFTCSWYKEMVEHDYPELKKAPNVIFRFNGKFGDEFKNFDKKVKEWFK